MGDRAQESSMEPVIAEETPSVSFDTTGQDIKDSNPKDEPQGTNSERSYGSIVRLAVGRKAKVDAGMQKLEEASSKSSWGIVVIRWILMILLACIFLFCLVSSKLSLMHMESHFMAARFSLNTTERSSIQNDGDTESIFLLLLISVSLPYAWTLLRSLWNGAFRSDRPWPSFKSLCIGVFASFLESAGIALFTIEVLSSTSTYLSVLLMNAIFLIPNVFAIVQAAKRIYQIGGSRSKIVVLVLLTVALVLQLLGVIISVFAGLDPNEVINRGKLWAIPITILMLSIAWSPQVQAAQLLPTKGALQRLRLTNVHNNRSSLNAEEDSLEPDHTDGISWETLSSDDFDDKAFIQKYPHFSARWKNSIICSFIKVCAVPGFCFLFGYAINIIKFGNLKIGLDAIAPSHTLFNPFIIFLVTSFFGYLFAWLACVIRMQPVAFSVPLCLATPVALVVVLWTESCDIFFGNFAECKFIDNHNFGHTLPAAVCLWVAQICCTSFFIFRTSTITMQKESELFWLPGYNSIFLEQHLLLNRKNINTNEYENSTEEIVSDSHVIICTTMYREASHEMEQLLLSLKGINVAKQMNNRNFESHVIFDNGVRGTRLTEFALQLVSIAKRTLGVQMMNCTKVQTPYGLRLTWELPQCKEQGSGMVFVIHLKDNQKVKNKKRWSQVMYMSYVLDYYTRIHDVSDSNTFILTTDADVKFSPESVEALLDLMSRDQSVGAVCARTHPLGSGPLLWYQIFDYAIGHWLQKATNDILGSVLCCPGCFSVYRAEALRDVLPTYASHVERATEFLTKDMGEDRWLCTLLVQSGWRLEYCAASENSTFCPEEFDEYFKQRRRWIPSTIANQILILQEWKKIKLFNPQISIWFMVYQALLLIATLLSPSICILVIVGGLSYAYNFNVIATTVVLILLMVMFAAVCIYCNSQTQLKVSKVLSVMFVFVMAAVAIGTIVQIVDDTEHKTLPNITTTTMSPITESKILTTLATIKSPQDQNSPDPTPSNIPMIPLPASVSTLYLAGLGGVFLLTALMHLTESYALLHGIFYLFALPAGNLLIITYSICNITDRSWGTREEKSLDVFQDSNIWQTILKRLRQIFFCCNISPKKDKPSTVDPQSEDEEDIIEKTPLKKQRLPSRRKPSRATSFLFHKDGSEVKPKPIKEWLPGNLVALYGDILVENGFDDTSFMVGVGDKDLQAIGVKSKAHRAVMLDAMKHLPEVEIIANVPDSVDEWLDSIGLHYYKSHFKHSNIISGQNLEVLKDMTSDELVEELGITKKGHLRRLLIAIQRLRYPKEHERQANKVKHEMQAQTLHNLQTIDSDEFEFWEALRQKCLLPDSVAFAHDIALKEKLTSLRNDYLATFAIVNAVWLLLTLTVVSKTQLNVFGTNPLGLCFLVVFSVVLAIQFICMIVHRSRTWMHVLARTPNYCGKPLKKNWSFFQTYGGENQRPDFTRSITDVEANALRKSAQNKSRLRYNQSVARRQNGHTPVKKSTLDL